MKAEGRQRRTKVGDPAAVNLLRVSRSCGSCLMAQAADLAGQVFVSPATRHVKGGFRQGGWRECGRLVCGVLCPSLRRLGNA
jgi:hypothetical protein